VIRDINDLIDKAYSAKGTDRRREYQLRMKEI